MKNFETKYCDNPGCAEIAKSYYTKTIKNQTRVFCSEECESEWQPCQVCGYPTFDSVCSEECGHKSYYGTDHPDTPQESPRLEPAWWHYQ